MNSTNRIFSSEFSDFLVTNTTFGCILTKCGHINNIHISDKLKESFEI